MSGKRSTPAGLLELAPRHKQGLLLANPVLLAAGVIGYGDASAPGFEMADIGGYVTAPVSRRPWRGEPPQVAEAAGGLLWRRGAWNPGVRRVLNDHAAAWARSPVPVIVHLVGGDPDELAAVAGACESVAGIAGLELDVPAGATGSDAADAAAELAWAVREAADLPLLARLPLDVADLTVQALLDAGADALVLARPPRGRYFQAAKGQWLEGEYYGPGLVPQVAARLADLATWVEAPLVACGGVHSMADALTYLSSGATAVMLDTAIWVDPELPGRIAAALAGRSAG